MFFAAEARVEFHCLFGWWWGGVMGKGQKGGRL